MKRLVFVLACVLVGVMPARAQMDSREAIGLQNQILQLRRDLQAVQQQGSGARPDADRPAPSRGDASGLTAQLLDRVSTLEDQMRQMRGDIDRLAEQQRRQAEDLNKKIADLSFAMQNAPSAGPARVPPAPPAASQAPGNDAPSTRVPPSAAALTPSPRTPELAMQEGNAALARRDYAAAEAAAREVLAKRGPRAADAQFLLAQAELGSRNYQQAAPDFYDAYNRQRTGPRAPSALLGVANALIGVGDKPSACEALAKLRTEFPNPGGDIREGETGARQRAGCR